MDIQDQILLSSCLVTEWQEPSKQPIITRYLDHVTGCQPIRYQYSMGGYLPPDILSQLVNCCLLRAEIDLGQDKHKQTTNQKT